MKVVTIVVETLDCFLEFCYTEAILVLDMSLHDTGNVGSIILEALSLKLVLRSR